MRRRGVLPLIATTSTIASLIIGMSLVIISSCGGGGSDDVEQAGESALRIDLIDRALADVHALGVDDLGYFEVNATAKVVNVFVAGDLDGTPNADGRPDAVVQYVYLPDQGLQEPNEPVGANGPTFLFDEVDFDADAVLDKVTAELPASTPSMFVITSAGSLEVESDKVEYRVSMLSSKGGELSVVVTADGDIVGTDAQ